MESMPEEKSKLDPFEHKPEPTFWQRVKSVLTFDRMVIFLFVIIAALVLTYRSGIHRRSKSFEKMMSEKAKVTMGFSVSPEDEEPKPFRADELQNPEPLTENALPIVLTAEEPIKAAEEVTEPVEAFVPYMTVQAASYTKKDRAEKEVKWLEGTGYKAFILTGKKHFVVCVGRFDKKSEADKAFKKMKTGDFKTRYKDAYVRPVKNP